eukprot:CAMPEP_0181514126 /NCGR_PEP_ID=MMETSP1110-20121109/62865_1 /TAXON_ID=174948 /ORGANISM="Symbiodinium sp., Strain CCMP421" /LENGTH=43 /DNA_ID= /DNA_START= /DNA_END= /DNA_ORIENTATION=
MASKFTLGLSAAALGSVAFVAPGLKSETSTEVAAGQRFLAASA